MNRIKLLLAGVLAAAVLSPIALLVPSVAYAVEPTTSISQSLCNGASNMTEGGDCTTEQGGVQSTVQGVVNKVINIFSWVVGIVSVIMIIYGGFKYITSGGDSAGVTSAKNTILFAIVGLVVVALAQIIVKFVIGTVSSAVDEPTGNQ